ncbi:MAG: hypothetical protein FWG83_05610 [Oscillospiraceae bacterium]|nr:hypothetical protein [Oscillospiraceae bacterium]
MRKRKSIAIALIAAMTIGIAGCSERGTASEMVVTDSKGRRDTPVRDAPGTIFESYIAEYSFKEVVNKYELIADVTIVEWLGETDEGYTFFEAKVNRVLKGEDTEKIEMIQSGNSKATVSGFPLLKNGDRFLLFSSASNAENKEFKGKYWIQVYTFFDIVENEEEIYLISRYSWFDDDLVKNDNIKKITGEKRTSINETHRTHDPILAQKYNDERIVFDYNDVITAILDVDRGGRGE